MTDTTYNGYTNRETWLVNLWIDNDQGSQEYWLEQAAYALAAAENDPDPLGISSTATRTARYNLSEILKDYHEEAYMDALPENLQASMLSDMLGAAFAAVDWDEIAEHMLDDVAEGVT